MRAGGGKQKGAQFERDVCEALSRWIDPGGTDTHYWRSAMSGGRATVRGRIGKKTESQSSDLSAITEKGMLLLKKFSIECKFVADLELVTAMVSARGKMAGFWEQVLNDARDHRKAPMMVAKQNMWPAFVFMRSIDADVLFGVKAMTRHLERARFCAFAGAPVSMMSFDDMLSEIYDVSNLKKISP